MKMRKVVRRSFLAAVTGTSALMLSGCGTASESGNNSAAGNTSAQPSTDAQQSSDSDKS